MARSIRASGGQVKLIRDFEPEVIMVTPSYLLAIVDEMHRQGIDPRATSLRYRTRDLTRLLPGTARPMRLPFGSWTP